MVLSSSLRFNPAGINHRVILAADRENSKISIGNNTGISGAVIHARNSIQIGNYVSIGANVKIFDHDFHSHDYLERRVDLQNNIITKPIIIEDDVWIGANSIILKGVKIGRASIIGAGSVVTRDIPPFTIWAGNPAKFIKKIDENAEIHGENSILIDASSFVFEALNDDSIMLIFFKNNSYEKTSPSSLDFDHNRIP